MTHNHRIVLLSFFSLIFMMAYSLTLHAEPQNLSLLTKEIKQYHDSGEYDKEVNQTAKKIENYLTEQTEYYQTHKNPRPLAIVLDIDETILSNYSKIEKRHFVFDKEQVHQEILAADAPAIAAMAKVYKKALAQGISVFFVTGRHESEMEATKENLRKEGFTRWVDLYVRPNNYKKKSVVSFKAHARELITQKGYLILASIGDQYSDLQGGYAKKQFKLPNPFYYIP